MGTTVAVHWSQIVTACAVPLIAGIAAFIAWQQMTIAKRQAETAANKLKLDLFERRLEVYSRVRTTIGSVLDSRAYSDENFATITESYRHAKWLFTLGVANQIRYEIDAAAREYAKVRAVGAHVGMDREERREQLRATRRRLIQTRIDFTDLVSPLLTVAH